MAEESNIINLQYEIQDDQEIVVIEPSSDTSFRNDLFTLDEINSLQTVLGKLNSAKAKQLVDLSHKETAWKDNIEGKKLINYQYAFDLLAI